MPLFSSWGHPCYLLPLGTFLVPITMVSFFSRMRNKTFLRHQGNSTRTPTSGNPGVMGDVMLKHGWKQCSLLSASQRQGSLMVEWNGSRCACKWAPCAPAYINCVRCLFLWPLWPTSGPWLSVQFEKSESRGPTWALVWGEINTITVPWSF